jgi:putative acetyltransferase
MDDITFQVDDPSRPEVTLLLAQLDGFLTSLYPPDQNYMTPVHVLCQPHVTFLTARYGMRPVGCGAILDHNGEYAEVKRMFVVPEFRGQKIAQRLLAKLETLAVQKGLSIVRLETGCLQTDAIRFYERAGYVRCGRFGAYPECELSVFFEKLPSK